MKILCLESSRSPLHQLPGKLGARGARYRPGLPDTYSLTSELETYRTTKQNFAAGTRTKEEQIPSKLLSFCYRFCQEMPGN